MNRRQEAIEKQNGLSGPVASGMHLFRESVIPCVILALGVFWSLHPMFIEKFAVVPGGLLDTRLVHFTLEHGHRSLMTPGSEAEFWDPPLFFPARNVSAYTDVMISYLPFYSPWRWLGAAPETAFQMWLIFVSILNYVVFYAVLRALGFATLGSSGGAFLFAFGSSRLANLNHAQLLPGFFVALAIFAICKIFVSENGRGSRWGDRPWIAVFFLALVAQAYGAFYPVYLFVLCTVCTMAVALSLPTARDRLLDRLRANWRFILCMAVVSCASIAPLLDRYLLTAEMLGVRPWEAVEPMLPRWMSWFLMGTTNRVYGGLQETAYVLSQGPSMRTGTHSNGLGLLSLAGIAYGWFCGRRRLTVRLLLTASVIVMALTTVLPGGQTLWRFFFEWLPGASAVRAIGRIGMFLLIPGALGLALALDSMARRRSYMLLGCLAVVVFVEHGHAPKAYVKADVQEKVASIVTAVTQLDRDCQTFYVSTFRPRRYSPIHEDAEWASLTLGLPTINGRYGNAPRGWRHELAIAHRGPNKAGPKRLQGMEDALEHWVRFNGLRPERVCWIEFDGEGIGRQRQLGRAGS